MISRVKLTIEYDGSEYVGWQSQHNGKSIQGEIEIALEEFFNKKVKLNGASRTDSGVHAFGQVAHFEIDEKIETVKKINKAINYILHKNKNKITILNSSLIRGNFHSRFSVKKKKLCL